MTDSVAFYEANAEQFGRETVAVDMAPLHARFLAHLPPGADILDAGCGAGRDALAFARLGHRVTAFDASPALAAIASDHLGQVVPVMRFDDVAWREAHHGIWACASLLHVPLAGLPGVFDRLAVALRPGGILYCSFKHGRGERESGGRHFTDMDEDGLARLVAATPALRVLETWSTADRRRGRAGECWLNALLQRVPALP